MFTIKGMSNADRELLRKYLVSREVPKNAVLFQSDRPAESMFFLENGAVKLVERKAADGRDDTVVGIIKPGQFCGEEALLAEDARHQVTAVTIEHCLVFEFSRRALQELMAANVTLGTKILLGISRNYRDASFAPQQYGRILVCYSAKDGEGKTSLAVNLAARLARGGRKTVVLDADLQMGNAHVLLGLNSAPNLSRLVQLEERLNFDRIKLYLQRGHGVDLLAAPDVPQEAELVTRSNLNQILSELTKNYDEVIVDCQSHIDENTLLLWDNADKLLITVRPDLAGLTRLSRLMRVFSRLDYPKHKFLFVAMKTEPALAEVLPELRRIAGDPLVEMPRLDDTFQKSLSAGRPWSQEPAPEPLEASMNQLMALLQGSPLQTT
ncbi:MAG TPA: cyclic nucleotide-binding domain-containing protein, partial [Candidatus Ozemobacteraceae bacterium]|nr:cyclic nucleotide-binding domain-containing protein [Candidatus Ozemobacteraceae bacterium]